MRTPRRQQRGKRRGGLNVHLLTGRTAHVAVLSSSEDSSYSSSRRRRGRRFCLLFRRHRRCLPLLFAVVTGSFVIISPCCLCRAGLALLSSFEVGAWAAFVVSTAAAGVVSVILDVLAYVVVSVLAVDDVLGGLYRAQSVVLDGMRPLR